jgi:hypothetical protein
LCCDCGYDFASGTMRTPNLNIHPVPTKTLRYNIHFLILIVLTTVLCVPMRLGFLTFGARFAFIFALVGVLHSFAIVVSLRDLKAIKPVFALCFIFLAGLWSYVTPLLGALPVQALPDKSGDDLRMISWYLIASAIGSSGYWILVRLFWLKSLRPIDMPKTVVLCMAATILSATAVVYGQPQANPEIDILHIATTLAWWFAFSFSLYWSETSQIGKTTTDMVGYVR